MTRSLGRVGLVAVGALVLALAGCTKGLPASVVAGSTAKVGWAHDVTSVNAATRDGATVGNREIAAMTRSRFARHVDGDVVVDESFGTVEVIDQDQDSFTVRYDLSERRWSDGIPVDAADLMLAWAAGSNASGSAEFASIASDLTHSEEVPEIDEFERRIDVAFTRPVRGWQTALDVAVPAHVVGQRALDIDDAMEAKQAVITAIRDGDGDDLAAIAEVWNTAFEVDGGDGDIASDLLLSSGPYRVDNIEQGESGTELVRLAVNNEYTGDRLPAYEHIELVAAEESEELAQLGSDLDVAQFVPTVANREAIRALERRDYQVSTSHTGMLWALVLRVDRGEFTSQKARLAFLRATPRSDLRSAGAGTWEDAYESSSSLLFDPASDGYTVALEDAGFRQTLESTASEPEVERKQAGVAAGASVCVLYDTDESFAANAFAELESAVAETGWRVRDCGAEDAGKAMKKRNDWHAVLTRVPVPESPREITAQWGGRDASSLTGATNAKRHRLVREIARTPDKYAARDLRVAVEAFLVREAVALPLAMDPVVTVADRGIENVRSDSGRSATLMAGASDWDPAD